MALSPAIACCSGYVPGDGHSQPLAHCWHGSEVQDFSPTTAAEVLAAVAASWKSDGRCSVARVMPGEDLCHTSQWNTAPPHCCMEGEATIYFPDLLQWAEQLGCWGWGTWLSCPWVGGKAGLLEGQKRAKTDKQPFPHLKHWYNKYAKVMYFASVEPS